MNNYNTGLPLTENMCENPCLSVTYKSAISILIKKRKTNHRQKVVDMPHSSLYVKKVINANDFVKERNKVVPV